MHRKHRVGCRPARQRDHSRLRGQQARSRGSHDLGGCDVWQGGHPGKRGLSFADRYAHDQIPVAEVVTVFERTSMVLGNDSNPDAQAAVTATQEATMSYETTGVLPSPATANALRAIIASDADETLVGEAQAILGPADNYGGRISFRYMVPLCVVLLLIFSALYARDRRAGGYRVENLKGSA